MTRRDEDYMIEMIESIRKETHENNIMLKAIVKYLANEARNANQENVDDFIRNILANMASNVFDISKFNRR